MSMMTLGRERAIVRVARLTALTAAFVTLMAARVTAQDTTKHAMPGMAGMPGMKMPKTPRPATKPRAAKAKKPATAKAKGSTNSRAKAKPMPRMADSSHAHMPDMPDSAHAHMPGMDRKPTAHDTTHAMPAMPGMERKPASDSAKHGEHDMKAMAGMAGADSGKMQTMPGMVEMHTPDPLGVSMDRMGSGTTWVPDAAPIPSLFFHAPVGWDVTAHGFAFAQYDRQDGSRGDSQFGSLNWAMLMASHALAGGRIQARTMLSLDAVTVTARGYPLLLQSGEAYDGVPLHDRQHPHDLFMELSTLYEKPITKSFGVMLYAAPSGEPALGPVAFMHRPSAMDNPVAPITHHWSDATHISFGVLSAGLFTHTLKLEASIFNGREPDQYRFNFDPIRLDSYSGRLTYNPTPSWSFTTGYGYLKSPEALKPEESMHRMTASALYGAPLGANGQWASSFIYGANKQSTHPGLSHSVLLESEAVLDASNTVFGRAEYVQKSAEELVLDTPQYGFASEQSFDVGELTLGSIREVARLGKGTLGIGAMATLNVVPSLLSPAYGSRTPYGALVFLRLRPFRTGMSMTGMGTHAAP